MRNGARTAGLLVSIVAAGCSSVPALSPTPAPAPAPAVAALPPSPEPAALPPVTPVVQSVPYPARLVSSKKTLAFLAYGDCEASLYDLEAGVVTAHRPACSVIPDPRGEALLMRYSTGIVEPWPPDSTPATGPAADDDIAAPATPDDGWAFEAPSVNGLQILDKRTGEQRTLHVAEEARFARLEVAPDGAVVSHLVRRGDGTADGGPCEALRTDAQGQTSVVGAACPPASVSIDLPSPDGAKTVVLQTHARPVVLMAPRLNLFVEDTTTRDRWFVDTGWRGFAGWSARGHRLLVAGGQAFVYEADTHRAWALREGGVAWAIDGDGGRAAAAQSDGTVHVVTVGSHDAPVVLPAAVDGAAMLALAGDRLAAVTRSGAVTVWDVARREILASWEARLVPQYIAWAGEGGLLAVAGMNEIRLSRPDGSHTVTLTALRAQGKTTWLARDDRGAFEGPPEALALLK